jgi:hypothetical protein
LCPNFLVFILTFFGSILSYFEHKTLIKKETAHNKNAFSKMCLEFSKVYLHFSIQHKILVFYTQYYLFQEKKFHLKEGSFIKFLDIKPQIRKKPIEIKKNTFSKLFLESFPNSKIPDPLSTLKITVPYTDLHKCT